MLQIPIYQVDAFSREPFSGNPAAVCPLERWLPDDLMQNIAQENNLSETVFFVKEDNVYRIRWFTPSTEVNLCGHATLASAHVLWTHLDELSDSIAFHSASGPLTVSRNEDLMTLNFPARPLTKVVENLADVKQAFKLTNQVSSAVEQDGAMILELRSETDLRELAPDISALKTLPQHVFYVTASSNSYDFVCRVFAPAKGIDEDPVTGSAYTSLGPYWAEKLEKNTLFAKQVSVRGGEVTVEVTEERTLISGQAITVMSGHFDLPHVKQLQDW